MMFESEQKAKEYTLNLMAKHINPDEISNRIDEYHKYYQSAINEEDKNFWEEQIQGLEFLSKSDDFQKGNHPQSIDQLMFSLIEWKLSIYAFQGLVSPRNFFLNSLFYKQWLNGAEYGVFCIIGKLMSKNKKDKGSLRLLWNSVSMYIKGAQCSTDEEVDYISDKLSMRFTNENSVATYYRNKVIAHNEQSPRIFWEEIDEDIHFICRVWSLLVMWSCCGIINPFKSNVEVFLGLGSMFSDEEIMFLKQRRSDALELIKNWCVHSLLDGKKVSDASPFLHFSLSLEPVCNAVLEKA